MSSYSLSNIDYVVTHLDAGTVLFGDHDEFFPTITPTDVAVRSGDYVATLATRLDNISKLLSPINEPEHAQLQQIVDELLTVDVRYQLTPKPRP